MINIKNVFFKIWIFTANLRINIVFELLDHIRITFEKINKNIFSIQINEIYVVSNSEFHRKLKIKTSVFKMWQIKILIIHCDSVKFIYRIKYIWIPIVHASGKNHKIILYDIVLASHAKSAIHRYGKREEEIEITIYSDFCRSIVYIDSEV